MLGEGKCHFLLTCLGVCVLVTQVICCHMCVSTDLQMAITIEFWATNKV